MPGPAGPHVRESQSLLGFADGDVMISTVSEFRRARESGAIRPLTRAPEQCKPISVCTANAKSIGVAPFGNWMTSPVGVNTKISSW